MHSRWLIFMAGFAFLASTNLISAQPGSTLSLKNEKPSDFAKKTLRAEKTGYGNLGKFQELMQNTFTRFNYLFNANNRLQKVLSEAIANYHEDYDKLLSFYPYDEKALSKNAFLDSVIQHATAGLLLHDLRNNYVDELYFLLGKSYFYEQKYDTAHQIFQYLNYAFAPKDEGYDLPIGSNISKTSDVFTILNPEKNHFLGSGYKSKQRRNDGLIWQVRNYIQMNDYVQAAALMEYIQKDIQLPDRLVPLLFETRAFFFYKQKKYDSAAINLVKTNYAPYKQAEKSRAYFLTGQLFAMAGDSSAALKYFTMAKSRTADPLMSIYAALQEASLQNDLNSADHQTHLDLLKKLGKKEKYARYKDVIYFAESRILSDRGQPGEARKLLLESIALNQKIQPPNPVQKSLSYFELASLDYSQGDFYAASKHYDSTSSAYLTDSTDKQLLTIRLSPLHQFKDNMDSMMDRDSLLQLALLPEAQRYQLLKEKAKAIRKAIARRGQQDDNNLLNPAIRNQPATDLFAGTAATGVAWYFNNNALKSNGLNLFRQKYGNRPNVDNWQRLGAISGAAKPGNLPKSNQGLLSSFNADGTLKVDSAYMTPEDLLKGLPMTAQAQADIHKEMAELLFKNGQILQNSLENFPGAIAVYDSLMHKYPNSALMAAALFNQYVCWILMGKQAPADLVKAQLNQRYPESKWNKLLQQNGQPEKTLSPSSLQDTGTKIYNDIYQLFIEGKFEEAYARKAKADQKYGDYYWTPQLLYIEAVYNITERKDSAAVNRLNYLIGHFSSSPIKPQATHLLQVLQRRKEIEGYLRNLKITPLDYLGNDRLARLENAARDLDNQRERRIAILKNQHILSTEDSLTASQPLATTVSGQHQDLSLRKPPVVQTDTATTPTPTPMPEPIQPPIPVPQPSTRDTSSPVANPPAKELAPVATGVREDTTANTALVPAAAKDSTTIQAPNPVQKEVQATPGQNQPQSPGLLSKVINGYTFNPQSQHYVAILLHKVAPVFSSEAANAFNRYNLLAFEHEKFNVRGQKAGDYDLILIGPFSNQASAAAYQNLIKPATSGTILPWLTPDKYDFMLISPQNEDKLKSNEDIINYLDAWKQFEAK